MTDEQVYAAIGDEGFPIGPAHRDRWLLLMAKALVEAGVPADVAATLWPYFVQTAAAMMNQAPTHSGQV